VITLAVDATDLDRHIFRIHETIPVRGGQPLILLYPKWLPGNHSPSGPLPDLAGLIIRSGGQRMEWARDTVDVSAFHVRPPAGATSLDLDFQFVSAVQSDEGRVVMTPEMLNLQWDSVSLYPAGYFTRRIPVDAKVTLPAGWDLGSAMEVASREGATTTFKTTPYETLVDSPIFAGRYFKRLDLDPGAATPVHMDIVADRPEALEIKPDALKAHQALVQQAYRLYGSHHYDHYDFLLSLTDRMGGIGLEHHRSSEDGAAPDYFTAWDKNAPARDLLPHEFTHSWNGKFRRPADLWTPNYDTPMRNTLLWVYEGQTQYWGYVLAARAGLLTKDQALEAIALTAATYDNTPGRQWKALQDTTNDPIVNQRRPIPWRSWQRSEDYYSEGQLIWLDADTLIRERSGGKRSLDDFAKGFFGVDNGSYADLQYTFDDVVKALNAVEPNDWAAFLRTRLDGHGPGAPLDGIARGGYRLVYTDAPSDYQKQLLAIRKGQDFTFSLGFAVGKDDTLTAVLWDSPAFKAGLTVGAKLIAVGGIAYDADRLKEDITAAKTAHAPLELLVKSGDHFRMVDIGYYGGLRYPHLEKAGTGPASLDAILTPKP
jgi:predicted metalloprotease with PDZ domain